MLNQINHGGLICMNLSILTALILSAELMDVLLFWRDSRHTYKGSKVTEVDKNKTQKKGTLNGADK